MADFYPHKHTSNDVFTVCLSCEMLPGPQYVLRQYEFSSTESFIITRYYYSDEVYIHIYIHSVKQLIIITLPV